MRKSAPAPEVPWPPAQPPQTETRADDALTCLLQPRRHRGCLEASSAAPTTGSACVCCFSSVWFTYPWPFARLTIFAETGHFRCCTEWPCRSLPLPPGLPGCSPGQRPPGGSDQATAPAVGLSHLTALPFANGSTVRSSHVRLLYWVAFRTNL